MTYNTQLAIEKLNQARAVLFDWDGTLVNSADFVPDIHSEILSQMGIPLSADIVKTYLGISQTALLKMALENNGKNSDEEAINSLVPDFVKYEDQIFDGYYADRRIHLRAGAYELLNHLKQKNIPMAVVSNAYDTVTHKRLRETGLMNVIFTEKDVFGRERVGTTKPNPQQIIVACEVFGCAPEDVIFFGDTQSDRGACHTAKAPMIQIGRAKLNPPSLIILENFNGLVVPSHQKYMDFGPAPSP